MKNVEDMYPLSPMQQGILFHSLYTPGSDLYVLQLGWVHCEDLCIPAYEQAWQQVFARHAILRTAFVWEDLDEPLQVVYRKLPLTMHYCDWERLSWTAQQQELKRFLEEDRNHGFHLLDAPLMRLTLIKLAPQQFHFVWTFHHLLLDGWSVFLILKDVLSVYEGARGDHNFSLKQTRPYRDYIAWLQQQNKPEAEAAWRDALEGFTSPISLRGNANNNGHSKADDQKVRHRVSLSSETTRTLESFAKSQRLTMGTLVQGAWALLLSRYSGQQDILFGVTVSGRPPVLEGIEEMVGIFINTLPLRVQVEPEARLLRWLKELQENQISLQQYTYTQLGEVQRWSDITVGEPLFESILVHENYPIDSAVRESASSTKIRDIHFRLVSNYPLTIVTTPGAQLAVEFMYDPLRFDAGTILKMADYLVRLLESTVERAHQELQTLSVLTDVERQQILIEWNDSATDYPRTACIHELFEQQVEQQPEAIALVSEHTEISYDELNRRANQLAHHLRSLGVGQEVRVGVLMERSIEMVVGLLGILKAGGAYLPLDPSYPLERLSMMLEDANAPVTISLERFLDKLPMDAGQVICLDTDWKEIEQHGEQNIARVAAAENLAYVMYTSGSTGRPKAVSVEHKSVVRLVRDTNYVQLGSEEVILQAAPITFDASTFEIWGSLLNGGKLVVLDEESTTVGQIAGTIERENVSTMWLTAGLFHLMVDESVEEISKVRQMLAGGEALSPSHVKRYLEVRAGGELINGYGPTENTTFSCCHRMRGGTQIGDSIPIGRTIANSEVYVLGSRQEPVGMEMPGEIYVGGEGLARGYSNDAEQTAEKFVPNEYGRRAGERIYRTGDIGRYLRGGEIEFIGRVDEQVKVRGYRIEPAEVRSAITEQEEVKDAVVMVSEDEATGKRLMAYVVLKESGSMEEVKRRVKERLPDYMAPSRYVRVEEIPLTANGKIDKTKLAEKANEEERQEKKEARGPLEEILEGIWIEVLGMTFVGVNEDFFEIGGHSLLATQMVSRVRKVFGVELALRTVFERPTIAGIAQEIEEAISEGKIRGERAIERASRQARLPLSYAQERLWFIDQLEPGNATYNIPGAVRMSGELDVVVLERALSELIRRHEILRTVFAVEEGKPVQIIRPAEALHLDVEDLSWTEEERRESEGKEIATKEAGRGFDLETGPLLRVRVLKLGEREHVVLLTMHHIISDGWSIGVMLREVAALYEAYARGEESPLEEPAIQYADYAVWQRQWLETEELERQMDYWRKQLEGAPALLELPTDRPRAAVQSYRGVGEVICINERVTEELKRLSRAEGVTLYMTLLATYKVLLMRYTHQLEIVVGADIANRNHREIEPLIGFFVNMLVLRTGLRGEPTFNEVLARVREVTLAAYANQDLPFEKLVEELRPERNLSHSPLFQVTFVLQNAPMWELELSGLVLKRVQVESEVAKYDLAFEFIETGGELVGTLLYSSDLFDKETIKRMAGHFQMLLECAVHDPNKPVSTLPLLSEQERYQLLGEWNNTAREYPREVCINELIEQRAEQNGEAVAMNDGEKQISYGELNRRANQLAHYLRGIGVGAEVVVGICMERKMEMIISMLAVLKAGGAYLPLDPKLPAERIKFIVQDSEAEAVICTEVERSAVEQMRVRQVILEQEQEEIRQQSEGNISVNTTGKNLAYVMYTSGSTGRPKGVEERHEALSWLIWNLGHLEIGRDDVVAQASSASFDAIVFEVWGGLAHGARVSMVSKEELLTAEELIRRLREDGITVMYLTAALFAQVVRQDPSAFSSLRVLVCGGEAMDARCAQQVIEQGGLQKLIHEYGPTETTVFSSQYEVKEVNEEGRSVPIGRTMSNTKSYVLDERLEPVPVGVTGEIYVGGDCVGAGYRRNGEQTAERFVPDGHSGVAGARMYRTGDLVRYIGEGEMEFIGRVDEQVKVRGYRIEPGEVRAAIVEEEEVKDAVVMVREEGERGKRLVAYVVMEGRLEEVKRKVRERLPEYMVPSVYVRVEEIPLTANGKVDKARLAEGGGEEEREEEKKEGERRPVEEILEGIWEEVLGVRTIGVEENFFEIGGHSLMATQMVSRVRKVFGVKLALRKVFERPTIRGIGEEVEREISEGRVGGGGGEIRRVSREGRLRVSYAQERLWFIDQLEPGKATYNIPAGVRMRGELDVRGLEKAVNEIIRRHEVLRTVFGVEEGEPVQVIREEERMKIEVEDVSWMGGEEREEEAERIRREEGRKGFDLEEGPLMRVRVVKLGEREHELLVTMHHIISDGWSIGVMVREMGLLYEGYVKGEEPGLEELEIQYADYAMWQREWLEGEELDRQMEYWRGQLEGAPGVMEVPTDRVRPAVQSYRGGSERIRIDEEVSEELKRLSRSEGVTLYMTLLAAYKVLLMKYTNQEDFVIGTPIANRNRAEIEELIGFFANTLALRTNLRGEPTFKELLSRVREVTLGAYAHQDMPFEKLVEELQPERSLSYAPLFQVVFVMQNMPQQPLEIEGLLTETRELDAQWSKYDLTMDVVEMDGGIKVTLDYSRDLYEAETVKRICGHIRNILNSVIRGADRKITELEMIGTVEREQILNEWNDTTTEYPKHWSMQELVERRVELQPEAIAIKDHERHISYAQLNRRANHLAHYLRSIGVGAEVVVGICMEKSPEMLICLVAVVKAGGAYLPLEPKLPRERMRYMVEDSGAAVAITTQACRGALQGIEIRQLIINQEIEEIREENKTNPEVNTTSKNLLYLMYTSGSTGRPKGVEGTHEGANWLMWNLDHLEITAEDVVAQGANASFDATVFEIWGGLIKGARVEMISREEMISGEELKRRLREEGVTVMYLTAALFAQVAREQPGAFTTLRVVVYGGEAIDGKWSKAVKANGAPGKLINVYGPTETTVFSSQYEVKEEGKSVPIGKTMSNTRSYVFDRRLEPVAIGVTGEIFVGGDCVTRGYRGNAKQTAERFMPDPHSGVAGARMYRTGDLVRYIGEGEMEFIGRVDEQVKVRGYRIEPGEVRAAIVEEEEVKDAVVMVREEGERGKRLVAYVVMEGRLEEVKRKVRERLPEYMVPSVYVRVEEIPLTANGKVDKARLAEGGGEEEREEEKKEGERRPVEEILEGIWEEVLGVRTIGVEENFFEIGGHSLMATQMVSRVRKVFGVKLALRKVFERPTIRGIGEEVEREISEGRVGGGGGEIRRVSREGRLRVSYAQERLWFIDQLEPGKATYNIPAGVRMRGELDVRGLEKAVNEIIRRHEVLRTVFGVEEGEPVQVIREEERMKIEVEDVSWMGGEEREEEAERIRREEGRKGFDLEEGPLMRVRVVKLGEREHELLVTMHHIISDGWSIGVMVREMGLLYEGYVKGEEPGLEELEIQYADYAMWQREWLEGEELDRQMEYWRGQLEGAPGVMEVPTDRVRPAVQSYRGGSERIRIDEEVSEELKRLSRSEGVTLYMTLLAAYKVLLMRYTNQADIVVGMPIANRTRREIEPLIGFFVNMLVLRTEIGGEPTFRELLGRVREVTLGAYAHQDMPFEKLVEELKPERSLSYSPLFQVMLALQNAPIADLRLPALALSWVEGGSDTAKYELGLSFIETEGGLAGTLQYSTDLFDEVTMKRMVDHFQRLVKEAVVASDLPVSKLHLLSRQELHQVVLEWNDTATDYPSHHCIHEVFEQQVEEQPDGVAIAYEDQLLTYAELNKRANQLAHHLRTLHVGPEVKVGVFIERSIEMVVSLLGILKAGGAYLPLDPAYPQDRLAYMLEDSRAAALLTLHDLIEKLPHQNIPVIRLDTDWAEVSQNSDQNALSLTTAENLAYVIYTSGSTGRPKGVCVTHCAVMRLVRDTNYVQVEKAERIGHISNVSFDAATFEVWGALLNGGQLEVVRSEVTLSPEDFAEQIRARYIDTMFITAALFNEMAWQVPTAFNSMKNLLVGGEALDPRTMREVLKAGGPVRLLNGYGPTESTTFSLWQLIEEVEKGATTIPVGRPLANTHAYILDNMLRSVPVGVHGELCLGGDGLARGYLNQPAHTAERFIPNPYWKKGGERIYRTGDIARCLSIGDIEFIGRVDEQVKVRGYRIEPGEVRAAIVEEEEVKDAVVMVREEGERGKRLVAYVVMEGRLEEVKRKVRERLPEYMVPSVYVRVEEIPLTANGKVDRARLAEGGGEEEREEEKKEGERRPVEEILEGIWEEVLGVRTIGVEENFFEIGGHSLMATQMVSRVRKVFGVKLALRKVFERPTIRGIGEEVEREISEGRVGGGGEIRRVSREGRLRVSYAQERLWFIDQLEPGKATYNIPAGVRMRGELDVRGLEKAVNEIIRRHEVLRTVFGVEEGEPVQVIREAERMKIEVEDLSWMGGEEREEEAERIRREEGRKGFDLEEGPLMRVRVVKLGEREHELLVTMHHIISDGWSIGVMVREMGLLYEAYVKGEEPGLEELEIQYADYAMWQREWLEGEELDRQMEYWRGQLEGAPGVMEVPTDRVRPAVQSYRGGSERIRIDEEVSEELKRLSRSEGVTLYMTLLAAYKVLLMKYTNQHDIVVGGDVANRNHREIEPLIGFFVNMLVLRTEVGGEPTFRELLGRVREVTLGAYAHQDMPFGKLVEELKPERSLSYTPVFQLTFVLQNAPAAALEAHGLKLEPIEVRTEESQFDLTLMMVEEDGRLVGTCTYSRDLFDEETIRRMSRQYQRVLDQVVEDAGARVTDLRLLSEAEEHEIAVEWNETSREYPLQLCIHELFEREVERRPSGTALRYGNEEMSYQELNSRAEELARHLGRMGVRAGGLVGLCMESCPEMIVGILGILKAGGGYLAMEPQYPLRRLSAIVEATEISVVVTLEKWAALVPAGVGQVVCIDTEEMTGRAEEEKKSKATPEDVAYVIYTSGSTGKPKGVKITHRSLMNYAVWAREMYVKEEGEDFALYTSLGFDLTVTSIYTPLISGNAIVVYESGDKVSAIEQIMRENRVKVLKLTPSHLRVIMERDNRGSSIRRLIVGGEALESKLAKEVKESFGGEIEIINEYGPTEATVGCMIYRYEDKGEQRAQVPIGRPAANMKVYVMDEKKRVVGKNIAGELYISGKGIAEGYWNMEEETRERFVRNEYVEGERMYGSGDICRMLNSGEIEYIGRRDEQVKFHGNRVELNELRSALNEHGEVRDSVVLLRKDKEGREYLIGYYASRKEIKVEELRETMRERVVAETIPSLFVHMRKLPLTLNGKVNVDALPAVEEVRGRARKTYAKARTREEQEVVRIWEEVLGVSGIGIEDNFFELGGHSLLAVQVISRVKKALKVRVELQQLFDKATVEAFAKSLEEANRGESAEGGIERVRREGNLPLSYAQQRLWFMDQLEPGNGKYNIPAAMRLTGNLDVKALERALGGVINRHEVLRTVFAAEEGEPVQVIKSGEGFKLEEEDLSWKSEEEREAEARMIAREEAERGFDLRAAPALRVRLLKLADTDHVVVFTMHHIISDGWSIGILVRELAAHYKSYSKGEEPRLQELPIQYADFAAWQRNLLEGETKQRLLEYWKKQLGGQLSTVELPMDRARPVVRGSEGAVHQESVPNKVVEGLKELSRREGASSFMVMLAALQTLLHRYTRQEDIVIGADIAGRTRMEIEGLIGNFVNILVLRTEVNGDMKFRELLQRVRDVTLGAYSHHEMPFEQLVEELQPVRDMSRTPLVQVVLSYQSFPEAKLEASGLEIREFEFSTESELASKKWDLALFAVEKDSTISISWTYNTDLFLASTISRLSRNFITLLESAVTNPDTMINRLEMITEEEQREQKAESMKRKAALRSRFRKTDLEPDVASKNDLVKVSHIEPDQRLPVMIQPALDGFDVIEWARGNGEFVRDAVLKNGAVLFRGCNVNSAAGFEELARAVCPDLFGEYGDLPREHEGSKVYGSTPYPSDQVILFHNESSHMSRWPMNIFFYCVKAAQQGGETPLLDCRKAYAALDPKIRERFATKHLMYVRNFTSELDVSWQDFFRTNDRSIVERYCREAGIQIDWKKDGGLRMRQLSRAVMEHPKTREMVFFNQILLHHISCLEPSVRESMLTLFAEEDLPRNVYYGDGTPIETAVVEEIRDLCWRTAVKFPWRAGDVLVVDNMLTAHARTAFAGSRKILVTMGEMISASSLSVQTSV